MPRKRSHAERRAMFHNMGTGAKVKLVKKFGINDVPVGSEGIIVEHFGNDRKQPVVAFHGLGRRVLRPDLIKVITPSNKFEPVKFERIKVYGKKDDMLKKFKNSIHYSVSDDGWVRGSRYLDNGEGDNFDFPYSFQVKDNEIELHIKKSDLPKRWQYDFADLKDDIIDQIETDVGMTR